jgi:hypothetical protein
MALSTHKPIEINSELKYKRRFKVRLAQRAATTHDDAAQHCCNMPLARRRRRCDLR